MAAKRTILSLTGIRGISALWVVFYHMQDAGHTEPRLAWMEYVSLFREGFRGVDLFFVLSGFILMLVHQDDFRQLTWTATARYFEMRFWRVYPLNAAVLVLIIAVYVMFPSLNSPDKLSTASIVQSFLLAQRWFMPDFGEINGPAWSLSVEVLGYMAFPLIAFLLNRFSSKWTLLGGAVLCLLCLITASLVLGFALHNVTGRMAIMRMFLSFIAGAALAALFAIRKARSHGLAWPSSRDPATISFILCVVVCSVPLAAFLTILPIAGLIYGLAYEEGPVNRLMASRGVVWLGQVSFSLYLTNITVLNLFIWVLEGTSRGAGPLECAVFSVAALASVVAVSAASHVLLEKPLAKMCHNFMSDLRGWKLRFSQTRAR